MAKSIRLNMGVQVAPDERAAILRALLMSEQTTEREFDGSLAAHLRQLVIAEVERLVIKGVKGLAADRLIARGEIEIGRAE